MQCACAAIAARAAIETSVVKRDVRLPLDGSKRPSFSLELAACKAVGASLWRCAANTAWVPPLPNHQACAIEQANRTKSRG
ncbi:hypothetical protein D0A40_04415 [Xanthomonas campestris pv. raphani]|nr:hypothetical protein D0A40_04415 [Xanthomonas campestris pv. raphani]